MNKKFISLCAAAVVCTGIAAQDQQKDSIAIQKLDEVVVSDSRFELKRENSGKTVIKISAEELERNQGKSVAEIINTKSGVEITGSRGREGAVYGVFTRGGRGRQVLVIIDGVRVSDPSSFSSEYDLRLLSLANIESIEIIKGAASTLYGTNAATAVISITTKKVATKKIALDITSSIGTNQTSEDQNFNGSNFSNSAQISGTLNKFTYSVGGSNTYSDGLSAIVTPENEEDPFSKYSVDVKLGYQFSKAFKFGVYGNLTRVNNEFDESFGFFDAPNESRSEQERIGINSSYDYGNGSLELNAAYSQYDTESITAFPSTFASNNYVIDLFHKYNFNDRLYTIIGVNHISDEANVNDDVNFSITDPYANVVYVSDFGLNLNAGARFNSHSEYGGHFVYNFNPSYRIKTNNGYVKALGSYATSYITPNLSQLFGAFGANPDLEPEENRTIEGGLEYAINNELRISAVYFDRNEKNGFGFDDTFTSINISDEIDANGVETELSWKSDLGLNIDLNYSFTERKGDNAIRIPKHKINALVGYQFCKKTYASLSYAYTGDRVDTDFSTFTDVDLEPFSLLNAYIGHEVINNKLRVFLSVDNILNESYTEVIGFTTKGTNARMGFSLSL